MPEAVRVKKVKFPTPIHDTRIQNSNDPTFFILNADKIVEVKEGKEYIPHSIFPEPGWDSVWENMGVVKKIEVIQW